MASLKRDTPAGRAALARRRQRAAAVADHSARFVHPDDEEATGASDHSNQSPPPSEREQLSPKLKKHTKPQHQQPERPQASLRDTRHYQRDLPQQKTQQSSGLKDPPKRPPHSACVSSAASYSAANLPSSDELLQRSSQVAQAAASVLASARKTKNIQSSQHYAASGSNKPAERELYLNVVQARKPKLQDKESVQSHEVSETPMQVLHDASRRTAENSTASVSNSVARMGAESFANVENHQSHQPQTRHQHQASQPPPSIQHLTTPKPMSSLDTRGGGGDHRQQFRSEEFSEDQYHSTVPEELITIEERETVISRQDEYEVLDAACLRSGSSIMLRSTVASATVANTASTQDDSSDTLALVGGTGLGTPNEVFQVVISDGYLDQLESVQDGMTPMRWGDTVILLSTGSASFDRQEPKVLGVRKRSTNELGSKPTAGQIGWFRPVSEKLETWTLLRGPDGSTCSVRIGLSASQAAKILAERRSARGECTRVVQSGDPLVLRHDRTGGLLSVSMADGSLELVSDSYYSNRGDAFRRSKTSGLLGQLQRHDQYLPMEQNTFTFIEACVPPCPRWILGGGTSTSCSQRFNPRGHRMYLHQTYLQQQNRNVASPSIQEKLFGNMQLLLPASKEQYGKVCSSTDLADQESILLDEVLGACLGLEGNHIRVNVTGDHVNTMTPHNMEFVLSEEAELLFDSNLRNLAERILPLCTSYSHINLFMASHLPGYEYGSVVQAFCEALDVMLQEYGTFVIDLEEQFRRPQSIENVLTMQKLHAYLMPSLRTMSILEKATFAVRDKTGGSLLNSLYNLKSWSCEGDLVANKVLGILLEKSSIPYMTMLTAWLQYGLLQDPYGEFMVEISDESAKKNCALKKHSADSDFNNESYSLREENVLTELISSDLLLQKVVAAGKYWRAVRTCEIALRKNSATNENTLRQSPAVPLYSLSFDSTASFIRSMYEGASQALVNLLMNDFNLMDALLSMKQYFLLDHGDFFLSFVDAAEEELQKELGDVSTGRIQHWLRMSIQLTELHGGDRGYNTATPTEGLTQRSLSPLALRCRFHPISLINHIHSMDLDKVESNGRPTRDASLFGTPGQDYGMSNEGLTGVETIVLDFPSVPFPISLVLSDDSISSYQLLFRLLFFAKYVERRLLIIWQDHQAMKELNSVRGMFGTTFHLRQRMLHFAQNLIYYFMLEVIEPNWLEMERGIGDPLTVLGHTVDDIVDVHEAFLHRTLEACLLTKRDLVRTLTKLMTTCLMFADQMKLFTEATRIHDDSSHIAAERRKAIQRSLNDRGGAGSKVPVDKMALGEAIHSFKLDRQTRLKKQKRRVGRELSSESYRRMVGRFEEVFNAYLSEFMLQLNSELSTGHQEHKSNLCIRLDYNGFLSSTIATDKTKKHF